MTTRHVDFMITVGLGILINVVLRHAFILLCIECGDFAIVCDWEAAGFAGALLHDSGELYIPPHVTFQRTCGR